ncbi:DUF6508 domain-containing protein [Zavarzinia compransoris]|uniref:Uncharacterized protein n=1 Tax=Zavarzinia compransoris TaxID=1264899 RepID=A0A317E3L0_9PROT|nr:DUF6508 domain-containing protein [Zavarzinia compransoris]PWR19993.1 hypothetical protein DKG75_16245 [Zavarzinia compransoris]TDP44891.1 hypothetical protein DES42_106111 [Zavarzinia compransoris]
MKTSGESVGARGNRCLTTDLRALADFLPAFRQPEFKAGEWKGGNETKPGVIQIPYVSYAPVVGAFCRAVYEHGWIKVFDWMTWTQSDEARSLRDDEAVIGNATPEQLAHLLTACIRQDRFAEGALMGAFESGLILRIVERAAVLAEAASLSNEG